MFENQNQPTSKMGISTPYTAVRDKFKRRKVSATRLFPKDCGRNAAITTKLNVVTKNQLVSEKIEDTGLLKSVIQMDESVTQGSIEQRMVTDSVDLRVENGAVGLHLGSVKQKEFPPRRRVSAIRQFPIGWKKSNVPRFESVNNRKFDKEIADLRKQLDDGQSLKRKAAAAVTENQEIVPYARNSLEYNSGQITSLDDEQNAPEHDDMGEKMLSVPRASRSPLSVSPLGRAAASNDNVVTRSKVRETLRLFQAMFRKLLQEDESKSRVPGSLPNKRIDMVTYSEMKKQNKCVNTGKKILGPVLGVEVGDEFHYRVELSIIGLHRPFQSGIDYVKMDGKKKKIVASSVVSSGGYDDVDNFDILVYSGQGGNPDGAKKKAAEDQKLERGNLALKNSIDEKIPVRVIRGFKETKGPDSLDTRGKMGITYTYDGLYLVVRYWQEKGRYGNNVFMFEMRRMPGQPELALREVQKSKNLKVREGLCLDDISQGVEKMRICAVNTLDSEMPPQFKYTAKMKYASSHNLIPLKGGCECKGKCSDSKKCLCAVKNGGEIPFNHNGDIVEAKTLVYECGPLCKCPPSCYNRVSQHGIKFQLEIFKTTSRGWGVRSLNSIPSGSFICEYTGELLSEKEADQRTGNDEYLFDLGRSKSSNQSMGAGLSNVISPDLQSTDIACENAEDEGFTIDAFEYGSVGRFINHSCSPNLVAQNVLYDHADERMPHIMLFAAENIPPLQELTYDYNYVVDTVHDSEGNIKIKKCYCGSTECTGRMY